MLGSSHLTANTHTTTIDMTRKLKAGEWYETGQLSPEEAKRRQLFYQKMAYIEMKKLRPKHPHV